MSCAKSGTFHKRKSYGLFLKHCTLCSLTSCSSPPPHSPTYLSPYVTVRKNRSWDQSFQTLTTRRPTRPTSPRNRNLRLPFARLILLGVSYNNIHTTFLDLYLIANCEVFQFPFFKHPIDRFYASNFL